MESTENAVSCSAENPEDEDDDIDFNLEFDTKDEAKAEQSCSSLNQAVGERTQSFLKTDFRQSPGAATGLIASPANQQAQIQEHSHRDIHEIFNKIETEDI